MISADILRGANFFGNPQERAKTGAKQFFKKFRLQNTSYGHSERLIDCIKSALKTKQQKRNYLGVPSDQGNNKIWFTYRFLS